MAIYKISPAAERDLVDIFIRGIREWGDTKANEFQLELISTFHILSENPGIGRSVAIRPHLQRYDIAPYVVFYRKFSYGRPHLLF